jgi:hypothetical protein
MLEGDLTNNCIAVIPKLIHLSVKENSGIAKWLVDVDTGRTFTDLIAFNRETRPLRHRP